MAISTEKGNRNRRQWRGCNREIAYVGALVHIKLRDGVQHDDLSRRNICRDTLIKGKHVVHAPRYQLEVLNVNVDGGGIPSRNYPILSE